MTDYQHVLNLYLSNCVITYAKLVTLVTGEMTSCITIKPKRFTEKASLTHYLINFIFPQTKKASL